MPDRNIEVIKAEEKNAIYTFYLSRFYSQEEHDQKKLFLQFLEERLGKADQINPEYGPSRVSGFAKTKLYIGKNKLKLDDIAMYTIKKGDSAEFTGDECHTVSFVCLLKEGHYLKKKIRIVGV